jgi:hypothetical protein
LVSLRSSLAARQNIRLFLSRAGVDVVAALLRSPHEELQLRATHIFTLFTKDEAMVRGMSKVGREESVAVTPTIATHCKSWAVVRKEFIIVTHNSSHRKPCSFLPNSTLFVVDYQRYV